MWRILFLKNVYKVKEEESRDENNNDEQENDQQEGTIMVLWDMLLQYGDDEKE